MKNLLMPTNFTTTSVKQAAKAIRLNEEKVNIIFFHAFQQPFYYTDLIRDEASHKNLITDELRQACKQLKEKYADIICTITFVFMRGDTNTLFRNFIEANNINMIVCPDDYVFEKIHKDSINPIPFFKRSRIAVVKDFKATQKAAVKEKIFADMEMAS